MAGGMTAVILVALSMLAGNPATVPRVRFWSSTRAGQLVGLMNPLPNTVRGAMSVRCAKLVGSRWSIQWPLRAGSAAPCAKTAEGASNRTARHRQAWRLRRDIAAEKQHACLLPARRA